MDQRVYTTPDAEVASFPIPCPEQHAVDELLNAVSLLKVLAESIESYPHMHDMLVVLDTAMRQLKPIELFLYECTSPEFDELFRACRRRAIVEKSGG